MSSANAGVSSSVSEHRQQKDDWSIPAGVDGQPERLLVSNLLNDLVGLATLLSGEMRRGSRLNAYLLAAGMNQIVEDHLHSDPLLHLGRAADYLGGMRHPAARLAAMAARTVGAAVRQTRNHSQATRRLLRWQADLATLVQQLADAAADPSAHSSTLPAETLQSGEAVVRAVSFFPGRLQREVLRLPSCFRGFDQQPADLDRIVQDFAQKWPDLRRPLLVIGLRTSGSYLAPLYAAFLKRRGYLDVSVLTLRPGHPFLGTERALARSVIRRGGLVLLTDDPPVSGASIAKAARELEQIGVPSSSIVLLLQLFGESASLPPLLRRFGAVLLPWEEWSIHSRLTPSAIQAALTEMVGPAATVTQVERVPTPPTGVTRSHVHSVYQVHLVDREGNRHLGQRVFVKGVGLGYFGEHSLAIVRALREFVPEVYGLAHGLLYRAWLPEERRLRPLQTGEEQSLAAAIASYVATRHRALPVEEDITPRLFGQRPVWEAASILVSRMYGMAWPFMRLLAVDSVSRRLLRVTHPSVIDGNPAPSQWFVADGESGLHKVSFDDSFFGKGVELACYDPVFDLASLVALFDLGGSMAPDQLGQFSRHLRTAGESLVGRAVGAERWLIYQLVRLWFEQQTRRAEGPAVQRASSRALQRYFEEVSFGDLASPGEGELCAIDIDGVLETSPLGFSGLTPTSAATLRSMTRHGYRPILASGRSLDEVRERCRTYSLAGGVAEYGAVVYNHQTGRVLDLLTEDERADLYRLRAALSQTESIHLDADYTRAVRAYQIDWTGRRRGLSAETIRLAMAKAGAGNRIRAIAGEAQTDFMAARIDKGTGLRALAQELGVDASIHGGKPLALAVGDTVSDLPMFELAALPCAPAHADPAVRRAQVQVMSKPYQSGLALAVSRLLGHHPGHCPTCQAPRPSPEARLFFTLLSAREAGKWGILRNALALWARERMS